MSQQLKQTETKTWSVENESLTVVFGKWAAISLDMLRSVSTTYSTDTPLWMYGTPSPSLHGINDDTSFDKFKIVSGCTKNTAENSE